MSPKMASLARYKSGEVDLYHNDMYGLKVTMAYLESVFNNDMYKRNAPKLEPRNMISSSDEALYGLTCVLHSTAKDNRQKEAIAVAARFFSDYFKEFGKEVDEDNFDLELILRNMDESNRLILYLQRLPNQTLPITNLTERLISRVSTAELWDIDDLAKH